MRRFWLFSCIVGVCSLFLSVDARAGPIRVPVQPTQSKKTTVVLADKHFTDKHVVMGGRLATVHFDRVTLNPQPLPPRWNPPWQIRMLNPQPLPPRK